MILKFLLLLLTTRVAEGVTQSYTGSLGGQTAFQQLNFAIPSENGILSAYFNITNMQYSNVLFFVSFSPITLSLTTQLLSSLVAGSDPTLAYMDVMDAIGDNLQIVNRYIPPSATSLYVGLFNFDLPEVTASKTYNLLLEFSNNVKICQNCPPGSSLASGLSCQCDPCPSSTMGFACQYPFTNLTTSSTFSLASSQNKYLLIPNPSSSIQITASELTNTGGVTMYVQYQYLSDSYPSGIPAGKLNSDYSGGKKAQQTLSSAPVTLILPSKGLNILLTFHNFATNAASVTVSLPTSQTTTSSVLMIVLAVVLSVVGFVIVALVIYKVRKCITARNSVVVNVSPAVLADSSSLTDGEIAKYFPEVSAAFILQVELSSSSSEININITANEGSLHREERETLLECSICFDDVRASDQVRVTYCRHIFHGPCLLQWFHKNQTCPNCRQPYDYDTTKRLRCDLGRIAKGDAKALVKAILGENFLAELQSKGRSPKQEQKLGKPCESKQLEEKERVSVGREAEVQEQATENQM